MMKNETISLLSDGNVQFESGAIAKDHFMFWRGACGQRYLATVYPIDALPDYSGVVVILARRCETGQREAVSIVQVEAPFQADALSLVPEAVKLGATEAHVHFLAQTAKERRAIVMDLQGHAPARLKAPVKAA